jgi:hypothetical protein
MNKIVLGVGMAATLVVVQAQPARDPTPQQQLVTTCNFEAKNRDLSGSERGRFVSNCLAEGRRRQQEVLRACNAEAQGKMGEDRRRFMLECVKR